VAHKQGRVRAKFFDQLDLLEGEVPDNTGRCDGEPGYVARSLLKLRNRLCCDFAGVCRLALVILAERCDITEIARKAQEL
jgi:hypothetical protein